MTCKEQCMKYKSETARYAENVRYCRPCEKFIYWLEQTCPCCGRKMRTRSKNSRFQGYVPRV